MQGIQQIVNDNNEAVRIATAPRTLANASTAKQVAEGVGGIIAQRANAKAKDPTGKSVETV